MLPRRGPLLGRFSAAAGCWLHYDGQEIRQSDEMGYAPGIVETELADEETKWAGIPPDPHSHAILDNRSLLSPAWYDDFLARDGLDPERRTHLASSLDHLIGASRARAGLRG